MQISLTREQETWLRAEVASGHFQSVEQAVQQLLDVGIEERTLAGGDLNWLKPFVDEGLEAFEKGEFLTLDEYRAEIAEHLARLKG